MLHWIHMCRLGVEQNCKVHCDFLIVSKLLSEVTRDFQVWSRMFSRSIVWRCFQRQLHGQCWFAVELQVLTVARMMFLKTNGSTRVDALPWKELVSYPSIKVARNSRMDFRSLGLKNCIFIFNSSFLFIFHKYFDEIFNWLSNWVNGMCNIRKQNCGVS